MPDRRQRVGLDHPERRERRRQLARLMDAAHGVRDALQHDAIVDLDIGDGVALDETSDQRALGFDEGDDLRADARDGCQPTGLMLDHAVDAQQRAARRRDPNDEAFPVHVDQVILVRDAAPQRLDLPRSAGPPRHPIHQRGGGELDVHRCIAYRATAPHPDPPPQAGEGIDSKRGRGSGGVRLRRRLSGLSDRRRGGGLRARCSTCRRSADHTRKVH